MVWEPKLEYGKSAAEGIHGFGFLRGEFSTTTRMDASGTPRRTEVQFALTDEVVDVMQEIVRERDVNRLAAHCGEHGIPATLEAEDIPEPTAEQVKAWESEFETRHADPFAHCPVCKLTDSIGDHDQAMLRQLAGK